MLDINTKYKSYYFIFMLFIFGSMFWAYIDAMKSNLPIKQNIQFYLSFGAILGLMPILFTFLKPKDKLPELNTVTYEPPRFSFLTLKKQILISVVVMVILAWRIMVTQTAFLPYPTAQIFEGKYASAIMCGVFGIVEDWVFFGVAFPITRRTLESKLGKGVALLPALIIMGVIFMMYHIFVYSTQQSALIAVFMFAVVSSLCSYFFNSLIVSNSLHFGNNLVASLIAAKVYIFI